MKNYNLSEIPEQPGIYMFISSNSEILYVGKAKNLKSRVSSYFNNTEKPLKTIKMVKAAKNLKFVVTGTESEALLLESNVIKTEKPRYNVRLKDSKSYPYIMIESGDFPRLRVTRDTSDRKAVYFGPFVNVGGLRKIVEELLRIFPLRSCTPSKFSEGKICLKYQIKKCKGPCEGLISINDYGRLVEDIIKFFKGGTADLKESLQKRMMNFSDEMKFEEAAEVRDRLYAIDGLFMKQSVVLPGVNLNCDAFLAHDFQNLPGITVLFIRGGKVIGSSTEFFEDEDPTGVMETFVMHYYNSTRQFVDSVAVFGLDETENLSDALSELRGSRVNIRVRGLKSVFDTAIINAKTQTELYLREVSRRKDTGEKLKKLAGTDKEISRVECVDISHLSGENTVGVSVVSINGEFSKKYYRKYKIKNAENDDFMSIFELFKRKYENISEGAETEADLYVIDGGTGQLNAALRARDEAGFTTPMISISKGRSIKFMKHQQSDSVESVHLPGRKNPVNFKKNDQTLIFIQRIRDESHRFAIAYSRKLALKEFKRSPLLDIEGIGPSRLKKFLTEFPDYLIREGLTAEEIKDKTGIPLETAAKILENI